MLEALEKETSVEGSERPLQPALALSWQVLDAARDGRWDEVGRLDSERTGVLTQLLKINAGCHGRRVAADLQTIYSLHQEVEGLVDANRSEVVAAAADLKARQQAVNHYNAGI